MICASTAVKRRNPANYKERETMAIDISSGRVRITWRLRPWKIHWSISEINSTSKGELTHSLTNIPMQKFNAGRVRLLNELQDQRSFLLVRIIKIEVDHMYCRCTIRVKRQWSKLVQKGINILCVWLTAEATQRPMTNDTISSRGRPVYKSFLKNSWQSHWEGRI